MTITHKMMTVVLIYVRLKKTGSASVEINFTVTETNKKQEILHWAAQNYMQCDRWI